MGRAFIAATIALLTTLPSSAQQATAPDTAFLQQALNAIQAQRDRANNEAAAAQAQSGLLTEQLAKAQARIKELEDSLKKPGGEEGK